MHAGSGPHPHRPSTYGYMTIYLDEFKYYSGYLHGRRAVYPFQREAENSGRRKLFFVERALYFATYNQVGTLNESLIY
jgi:hypothetical protein